MLECKKPRLEVRGELVRGESHALWEKLCHSLGETMALSDSKQYGCFI